MVRRIYFVREKSESYGLAIVADSLSQAKKIAYSQLDISCDWIDMRANVLKGFDDNDLKLGVVEPLKGLELGVYGHVEDIECPICKKIATVYNENDNIGCMNCLEE